MGEIHVIPGKVEEEPGLTQAQCLAYIRHYGETLNDGRVKLTTVCDGCYAYLINLCMILDGAGYNDIETQIEDIPSPDVKKPWMTTRFVAIGGKKEAE